MAYKIPKYYESKLKSAEVYEGEPIELKIERIMNNNEPIKDGAPEIFTERAEGVISAYNIRTDRWEVAAEAMDHVSASHQAKREQRAAKKEADKKAKNEAKVVKMNSETKTETKGDSGAKSTNGTNDS
jgi:hypothetical protein